MYIVSVTAQDYFVDAQLTTISTTKDENEAPAFSKVEVHKTLKMLRRRGYDPLLIKIPHAVYVF